MSVHYQDTRCTASVTRHNGDKFDISNQDILSCTVSRDVIRSGSFSLTLKPHAINYFRLLQPNDYVDITFKQGNQPRKEIVGLIDGVVRTRNATGNNTTVQVFQITGREAARKIIDETDVWYDPHAVIERKTIAAANTSRRFKEVGIQHTDGTLKISDVPKLIQSFAGDFGQWRFPGTKQSFVLQKETLDLESYIDPILDGKRIDFSDVIFEGNLGRRLDYYADRLLQDFYFDVLPTIKTTTTSRKITEFATEETTETSLTDELRTCLVFRRRPYGFEDFTKTRGVNFEEHIVFTDEAISENIGFSDAKTINVVKATASGLANSKQGVGLSELAITPRLSRRSIQQNGLRKFYGDTIYPFSSTDTKRTDGVLLGRLNEISDILQDWYIMNDRMLSGTITLGHMRNEIRAGHKVKYINRRSMQGFEFLVESLTHQYNFTPSSTTQLNVVRGIPTKNAPEFEEFRVERLLRLVDADSSLFIVRSGGTVE